VGLRCGGVAIREPTGIFPLAKGAAGQKESTATLVAARARDFGNYRLSATFDPRGDRTNSWRVGRRSDANVDRARPRGSGGASGGCGASEHFRNDRVVFGLFWDTQFGGSSRG